VFVVFIVYRRLGGTDLFGLSTVLGISMFLNPGAGTVPVKVLVLVLEQWEESVRLRR
jgi:hypothetical protein